jgi:hypothetical protein
LNSFNPLRLLFEREIMMKPVIVTPLHDPEGVVFPHLFAVEPQLKAVFGQVMVGITPSTCAAQSEAVARLTAGSFYRVTFREPGMGVGEQLHALYTHAATVYDADQVLHLCFMDRVVFALQNGYRQAFLADVQSVDASSTPLMFHRSTPAWRTHPQNYYDIERMATQAGELLFGKTLDFAWCHLVIRAGLLQEIMPGVKNTDISMLAEMTLLLRDQLVSKDVDWLAWEDPFLFRCDAAQLKIKREHSPQETRKRLAYIAPTLQAIANAAN